MLEDVREFGADAPERGLNPIGPILIVDDDQGLRESFRELLETAGCAVQSANGGNEALDLMIHRGVTPALIVLDLEMPGMGGAELVAILECYHRFAEVPILLVSGSHASPPSVKNIAGHLRKPVAPALLLEEVLKHARVRETG